MRKIIISGASRGIGLAISERMLKDNHQISVGVRDVSNYKSEILTKSSFEKKRVVLNEYQAKIEHSAKKWVDNTVAMIGGIDTLIISSGIFKRTGLIYENETEIKELLDVNLMGPWYLIKAAWNELKKSKQGRIIVLVSMSGKRSKGNYAGYSASKFALMGLCETARNEGWADGIRVTTLCPGWVNTDMAKRITEIEADKMTQPEDIAEICSSILKLPNSSVPFEIKLNCLLEK